MWPKEYKDYPPDSVLKKEKVAPLKGIVGCEMNEVNGWGESFHWKRKQKRGVLYTLLMRVFGTHKEE